MLGTSSRALVGGGLWLYLSMVSNNFMGFLFWALVSAVSGPGLLGSVSAVAGLSSLIAGLADLGVGAALLKRAGACMGPGGGPCRSRVFWSSLALSLALRAPPALALAAAGLLGVGVAGYSGGELAAAGALVALSASDIPAGYLASQARTLPLFASALLGNALKVSVGVGLVLLGFGWAGALAGLAMVSLVRLAVALPLSLRDAGLRPRASLEESRGLLAAGLAVWLPGVIGLAAQQLGVISSYSLGGSVEAGLFYISRAIAWFVVAPSTIFLGVLLPVLSHESSGRAPTAGWSLRLSLALVAPAAAAAAAYPEVPLGLLGEEYLEAAPILRAMVAASVLQVIAGVAGNYIYASGRYRDTLAAGLAASAPTVALYPVLIPGLGGLGAALSILAGTLTGLAYALPAAYRAGYAVDYRVVARALAPPAAVAAALHLAQAPPLLGIPLLALSYPYYARTRLVTRGDLREVAAALLPERVVREAYRRLRPAIDYMFPE